MKYIIKIYQVKEYLNKMAQLAIIFDGLASCKELRSEIFAVSEQEWLKYFNMKYRKPIMQVPGYSSTVNIADVFAACRVVLRRDNSETPFNYLASLSVMPFVKAFAANQRSQLEESYY